ncbi:glycosyltransferase [Roseateles sp. LYH14W]|uniref:Glycosyltransferase n=1 Tax=Pelomonas parva TaxID=3299032 RepID=A0ABW7EVW6_9BURK
MNEPALVPDALRVSVVIPVYRGAKSLPTLIGELMPLTQVGRTPSGVAYRVCEILLVHDCGPDGSDQTIEALAREHPEVRPVWLSRNFGQHAATLAGIAGAVGNWIATLDEDGQQNPADLPRMLDTALTGRHQLVYAEPTNPPPHGVLRNAASRLAKSVSVRMLGNAVMGRFNSYRLIDGEIARSLAAYCGYGVYLDVGLSWLTMRVGHCPVHVREESDRPSGYSLLKLVGHFWALVLTSGTRPLRLITLAGGLSVLAALGLMLWVLISKLLGGIPVQGWASLVIVVSFFSGAMLMALGVIAEYLAVTMGIAMGRPLYVVSSKPTRPPTE